MARERATEEEEVAPEDSASTRVSPTNEVTNSLDALALICDELASNEDVAMEEEAPQGFKEALQSFRAMNDELKAILEGDAEAQFDLSLLRVDFVYRADRLIPCGVIIYTVTSTSPWHGLSALELLIRSQLWL